MRNTYTHILGFFQWICCYTGHYNHMMAILEHLQVHLAQNMANYPCTLLTRKVHVMKPTCQICLL